MSETPLDDDSEVAIGTIVAGRYRVEKELGRGGMGAVYKASHIVTERVVALKTLLPKFLEDPQVVGRFVREAKAASAVQHPNAIEIIDVFVDGTVPYLVMEYLPGKSLAARLSEETKLSVEETAKIMVPVLGALGMAHSKKIVHRDLKPDNIFLCVDETTGLTTPKVLDFGIAKVIRDELAGGESARLTQTGALLGTPLYMSPEQISGRGKLDHRSDIWSIGVVLYELLTGELPFEGENFGHVFAGILQDDPIDPIAHNPAIPSSLNAMILRCLAKRAADRPESCGEIAAVLASLADVGSYTIPPPSRDTFNGNVKAIPIDVTGDTIAGASMAGTVAAPNQLPPSRSAQTSRARATWVGLAALVLASVTGLTYALRSKPQVSTSTGETRPQLSASPDPHDTTMAVVSDASALSSIAVGATDVILQENSQAIQVAISDASATALLATGGTTVTRNGVGPRRLPGAAGHHTTPRAGANSGSTSTTTSATPHSNTVHGVIGEM